MKLNLTYSGLCRVDGFVRFIKRTAVVLCFILDRCLNHKYILFSVGSFGEALAPNFNPRPERSKGFRYRNYDSLRAGHNDRPSCGTPNSPHPHEWNDAPNVLQNNDSFLANPKYLSNCFNTSKAKQANAHPRQKATMGATKTESDV